MLPMGPKDGFVAILAAIAESSGPGKVVPSRRCGSRQSATG